MKKTSFKNSETKERIIIPFFLVSSMKKLQTIILSPSKASITQLKQKEIYY